MIPLISLATIGATTALLWISPAIAAEQVRPGATAESFGAIAKRLNPTVAAEALEFHAALHRIGTAAAVFESERRLRSIQLVLLKLRVGLQSKYTEMERLSGGSL